jgi:hypothetical protein
MLALQWPTLKSLHHVHLTWTLSVLLCMIGWSRILFASNESTQNLIWPTYSPRHYNMHLSTGMWISS